MSGDTIETHTPLAHIIGPVCFDYEDSNTCILSNLSRTIKTTIFTTRALIFWEHTGKHVKNPQVDISILHHAASNVHCGKEDGYQNGPFVCVELGNGYNDGKNNSTQNFRDI